LEDTVDSSTGFKFTGFNGYEMLDCLRGAITEWGTPGWRQKMETAMLRDHSWGVAAGEYSQLYRRLLAIL
jgi:glycogen synthase